MSMSGTPVSGTSLLAADARTRRRNRAEAREEAEHKAYWQDLYRKAIADERRASERLAELRAR